MMIGTFYNDRRTNSFTGEIKTLVLQRENVQFLPNDKRSDNEPDYRIVEKTAEGSVELGAAWKRRSSAGADYLSVVLDDPALSQPINAALMLPERDGAATLVWSRPQRRQPSIQPDRSPR
ncbi:MAG TPA: DUF736 domain-containing protein [Stellaceae bacterium]|jgi:uncharacterized protein (DUF736 family)|nr:DUF736 domain-containing protein [Stellaceae bacterium]